MDEIGEGLSMSKSDLSDDNSLALFRPPADITDLATVLKTEENSGGKDFIFRKGTTSDVFSSSKNAQSSKGMSRTKM